MSRSKGRTGWDTPPSGTTPASIGAVPAWIHLGTFTHAQFSDTVASKTLTLFTLVAGGIISGVKIKHSVPFAGSGFTGYTIEVGIIGPNAALSKYASPFAVFQDAET